MKGENKFPGTNFKNLIEHKQGGLSGRTCQDTLRVVSSLHCLQGKSLISSSAQSLALTHLVRSGALHKAPTTHWPPLQVPEAMSRFGILFFLSAAFFVTCVSKLFFAL